MASTASIIRQHYNLSRLPTAETVAAEIANLQRKADNGALCDRAGALAAALDIRPAPGSYMAPRR